MYLLMDYKNYMLCFGHVYALIFSFYFRFCTLSDLFTVKLCLFLRISSKCSSSGAHLSLDFDKHICKVSMSFMVHLINTQRRSCKISCVFIFEYITRSLLSSIFDFVVVVLMLVLGHEFVTRGTAQYPDTTRLP